MRPGTFTRACGNIPGGTPTLADMFRGNVSASEYVPPERFRKSAMTTDNNRQTLRLRFAARVNEDGITSCCSVACYCFKFCSTE